MNKNSFIKFIFTTTVLSGLIGCGRPSRNVSFGEESSPSSDENVEIDESSSFSYTLSENGCDTGEQKFDSFEAMCDGLRNDSLNSFCAYNLREAMFIDLECSGSF